MKKTSSKKSAFSLIELSIVLIIIGLLIAGVTGGASLVRSSELRAVVGEARGYAVAVNSFYTQYNAYPGDYATVIGSSVAGDADGTIEYYSSPGYISESANAWLILRTIGAIDTLTNTSTLVAATTSPTFGTYAPASKIKSAGWAFDYRTAGTSGTQFYYEPSSQNTVVLTGAIGAATSSSTTNTLLTGTNLATAALYTTDALSIDTKVDDANPGTGTVRGLNVASSAAIATTNGSSTAICFYGTTVATIGTYLYNTAYTSKICGLTYQVDVSSSS